MTISLYQASVPSFLQALKAARNFLAKGATHAEAHKIDPTVLLQARLFPNMFPLVRQIQVATDFAKGSTARLAGIDPPKYEDKETTFAELQTRLDKTIAYLETFKPEQIDGQEDRDISLPAGGQTLSFKGQPYLLGFALPNFYFHLTAAYSILRHNGVELAKRDFLGM